MSNWPEHKEFCKKGAGVRKGDMRYRCAACGKYSHERLSRTYLPTGVCQYVCADDECKSRMESRWRGQLESVVPKPSPHYANMRARSAASPQKYDPFIACVGHGRAMATCADEKCTEETFAACRVVIDCCLGCMTLDKGRDPRVEIPLDLGKGPPLTLLLGSDAMSGDLWKPQGQDEWVASGKVSFLKRTTKPMVASFISVHLFRAFDEFENFGSLWLSAQERTAEELACHEKMMRDLKPFVSGVGSALDRKIHLTQAAVVTRAQMLVEEELLSSMKTLITAQ